MESLVEILPKRWFKFDWEYDSNWVAGHVSRSNVSKVKSVDALKLSLTVERTVVRMVSERLKDRNILEQWEAGRMMMEMNDLFDDGGIDCMLPYQGRRATFDVKVIKHAVLGYKWLDFKCADASNIESRYVILACVHDETLTVFEPIKKSQLKNSGTKGKVFCRPMRVKMPKPAIVSIV